MAKLHRYVLTAIILIASVSGKDGPLKDQTLDKAENVNTVVDESAMSQSELEQEVDHLQEPTPPSTDDLEVRFNCLEVSGSNGKVAEDVYELCEKEYWAVMETSSTNVERLLYSLTRGSLLLLQMDDFEEKPKILQNLNTLIGMVQLGLESVLSVEQKANVEDIKQMLQSAPVEGKVLRPPVTDFKPPVNNSKHHLIENDDIMFYLMLQVFGM